MSKWLFSLVMESWNFLPSVAVLFEPGLKKFRMKLRPLEGP